MAEPDLIVAVKREDGESLVLNGLTLARAFFTGDPSSKPGGYDSLAGSGDRNRIVAADVIAMNTTMRARSKHAAWKPLLEDDQAWLRNLPFKLDIMQGKKRTGSPPTAMPCFPKPSPPASTPALGLPAPPRCCTSSGHTSYLYSTGLSRK
jgi:hypothetical protein